MTIMKREDNNDNTEKRDFSTKERQAAADTGAAMPDGSFPIKNVSDLHNAVSLVGRASSPESAKRHIIRRAKALGAADSLPEKWSVSKSDTRLTLLKAKVALLHKK